MINLFKKKNIKNLEELLNDKVSFTKLQKSLKIFLEKKIREIGFIDSEYKINVVFKDFHGYDKNISGSKNSIDYNPNVSNKNVTITINNRLIDAFLFNGDEDYKRLDLFITIFHELYHLKIEKMFIDNKCNNDDLYKDTMLRKYFEDKLKNDNYYFLNYKYFSEEILCNIHGISETIKFLNENNLTLSNEELNYLKEKYDLYLSDLMNKNRINPIDNKVYNLDELYESLILSNNIKR